MRRFSCTVAVRYRPTMACTNSCRAPALILGIVPPFVCHAPVANFVRQRDPPGNKSGDAMRPARIIDVDQAHHWEEAGEALEAARWHKVRSLLADAAVSPETTSLRMQACRGIL